MEYRLPSNFSSVRPDVESVNGSITFYEFPLEFVKQRIAGKEFFIAEMKPIGNMPSGNNQAMPFTYREPIPEGNREIVLRDNSFSG